MLSAAIQPKKRAFSCDRRTPALAMNCWHCARRNCGFYYPSYNNSCRESTAEGVVDKERFNFCEYFIPSDAAAKPPVKKTGAQDKLEALFKKKS